MQSQTEYLFPSVLPWAGSLGFYYGLFSLGKTTKPRHSQIVKIGVYRTQSKATVSTRGVQKLKMLMDVRITVIRLPHMCTNFSKRM